MATWCGPCTQALPEIQNVVAVIGSDNIQVISLDVDTEREDEEILGQYRDDHGITWPMAMDTPGLGDKYKVESIPTLILYDTEGNILKMWEGLRTSDEIIEGCEEFL
jgi:thiol-disulfide isomerase/thioredoxin